MLVAHCPPVTEFRMFRPDTKYPLGFSVKDGLVCVWCVRWQPTTHLDGVHP